MIITEPDSKLETNGIINSNKFTINASAKAFKILSSSLYKNKILAIIRELSCNAYDAHIANGNKETPFDISLPNPISPNFKIRDFGTGMSNDDILNLYTTYFNSTKTESNDYIGALGLGSKSPFSYTNSFLVTSYFDNKKSIYSAYLDDEGMPNISLMMVNDSDEKTGIEIEFPVNKDDISQFRNNANMVFHYFDNKPNMLCKTVLEEIYGKTIKNKEYSTDTWKLFEYSGTLKVIQGNIAYPVSHQSIANFPTNLEYLLKLNLDIYFDIGSVDISASREELSYDKHTSSIIIAKLIEIDEYYHTIIQTKFDKCDSLWAARNFFNSKHIQSVHYMLNARTYYYNDIVLKKTLSIDISSISSAVNVFCYGENPRNSRRTDSRHKVKNNNIINSDKTILVFNTSGKSHISRIKEYNKYNSAVRLYEFVIPDYFDINKILDLLGNPKYKNSSDLKPARREYSKNDTCNKEFNVQVYNKSMMQFDAHAIDTVEDIPGKYYVNMYSSTMTEDFNMSKLNVILLKSKELGLIDDKCVIIGINKGMQRRITDMSEYTHIIDHIKNKLYELYQQEDIDGVKAYDDITPSRSQLISNNINNELNESILDPEFGEYISNQKLRLTLGASVNIVGLRNLMLSLNILQISHDDIAYDKLVKKYPLLDILPYMNASECNKHYKYYVNYINSMYLFSKN